MPCNKHDNIDTILFRDVRCTLLMNFKMTYHIPELLSNFMFLDRLIFDLSCKTPTHTQTHTHTLASTL